MKVSELEKLITDQLIGPNGKPVYYTAVDGEESIQLKALKEMMKDKNRFVSESARDAIKKIVPGAAK